MPEYQANPDIEYTTDIRALLGTAWRWAWLLALGLVLGIGAGYVYNILQKPVYQATTKVLVTRAGQAQSTDISGAMNLQQLTDTYVQFLTMDSTMDAVSKDVDSPV